ncbi:SDR family NAD(P)-dependent oxidoreductase [Acuticoccus sp. I52.16.1]|uniref:SDR family NAD(P)-dependent oxidoreductase n=1 Tax=Acuticoccus sp. I52.16.1 TaxID=2928472 RepID=UPI001FD14DE6|nr:glucose 1-dehydrogenase [Acuticoccus sp. I52.16.1]UOM36570.1 glucose 1-dehydrogenase [Acuticoccus sp. I52.16.1]
MFELDGTTVLVTGASSGLGAHFARMLAGHGASVVLAARRVDALALACEEIRRAGGRADAIALDVTDAASVSQAVALVRERHGRIHAAINNAGVTVTKSLLDHDAADWDRVLDTNLRGPFLVGRAVAEAMREDGGGAIVNVASILGLRVAGQVASYATSKAGLVQLTKAMALEWARYGVRVNALCPGYMSTDLNRDFFDSEAGSALVRRIPQRRLGQIEELDGPLLLLCSAAGSYMTGSVVAVDGGHLVSSL